jgi:thiamine-phosphate pyrophosphorylase
MRLCLVTHRLRLAAAMGASATDGLSLLVEQVAAAAGAGVDVVQVREPDLEGGDMVELVRRCVAVCASTATKVVVNDRLDVALAAGAHGVHLKEQSFAPEAARRLTPRGFLIGCSVHSIESAVARRSADYLIAGTVQPTVSKPAADYLDWAGLAAIVRAASPTPVLGIGGLDVRSIPSLAETCAAGLAAVGAFLPEAADGFRESVQKRVTELRFAFDSVRRDP